MGCGKSKVSVTEPSNISDNPKPENNHVFDPNPPIKPPKNKKKDAVPAPESFAAVDEHALKAPGSVRTSASSLAQYLVKSARNDIEKVRAIYRWIAENISYDTAGFFKGNVGPQTAEAVLQRGTSVCEGYSTLFKGLCTEIGIPCKKVSGFSKGFGYNPEKPLTENSETSHAWNIVFVNGEWRPIESTWGAGHLNSSNKFEKGFKELYFLTDPEDFVIQHFPFMNKDLSASLPLQLLKQPISLEKFNTVLSPKSTGIEWGFEASHKSQVVMLEKECEITFRTTNVDLESVSGHLIERNTGKDCTKYILLNKCGDRFVAKVTPPNEGTYKLELYGKSVGDAGTTHHMLVSYIVRCQSVLKDVHPFPYMYTAAQEYGCLLIEPLNGDLPANQDIRLKLRSDQLIRLMISKQVHEKVNGEFDFTFKTTGKGETVGLFGSSSTSGSLNGLYVFNVV